MLTCLRVRSFAVIEALEVELDAGLNIVTGETGAGKEFLFNNLFTQLNRIYRELLPGQGTLPLKKTTIAAYSGQTVVYGGLIQKVRAQALWSRLRAARRSLRALRRPPGPLRYRLQARGSPLREGPPGPLRRRLPASVRSPRSFTSTTCSVSADFKTDTLPSADVR